MSSPEQKIPETLSSREAKRKLFIEYVDKIISGPICIPIDDLRQQEGCDVDAMVEGFLQNKVVLMPIGFTCDEQYFLTDRKRKKPTNIRLKREEQYYLSGLVTNPDTKEVETLQFSYYPARRPRAN